MRTAVYCCYTCATACAYCPFASVVWAVSADDSTSSPSGIKPSANILSNRLTSSAVFARVKASTTRFFSSGVMSRPFPPFPTADFDWIAIAPAGTAVVDVESFTARAFGNDVAGSVSSFRADSRSASFIRSWSSVRSFPFATWSQIRPVLMCACGSPSRRRIRGSAHVASLGCPAKRDVEGVLMIPGGRGRRGRQFGCC